MVLDIFISNSANFIVSECYICGRDKCKCISVKLFLILWNFLRFSYLLFRPSLKWCVMHGMYYFLSFSFNITHSLVVNLVKLTACTFYFDNNAITFGFKKLFKNYLKDCTFRVSINNYSSFEFFIDCGVP